MFALAGMAMLALTQCGPSGSKEYKLGCKLLDKMESSIKSAKTCEDLEAATMEFYTNASKMSKELTDEVDKATKEETEKLNARFEEIGKIYEEREAELCK